MKAIESNAQIFEDLSFKKNEINETDKTRSQQQIKENNENNRN